MFINQHCKSEKKGFYEYVCVFSHSPFFKVGYIYPCCGGNNGLHIMSENNCGDPFDALCHNYDLVFCVDWDKEPNIAFVLKDDLKRRKYRKWLTTEKFYHPETKAPFTIKKGVINNVK